MTTDNYTEPARSQALLPPPLSVGVAGWVRANLFSSWFNGLLTIVSGVLVLLVLWFGLKWVFLQADWTVIVRIGGGFVIGQYNTTEACPGNNCFWRPQAVLLLVTFLLGMAWGIAGAGLARRIAMVAIVAITLSAFLPYSLDKMGLDVRVLLLANIPAMIAGWALARYTGLGTVRNIVILAVVFFVLTLVLLRGIPGVPGMQPVKVHNWGGLMLNLLLSTAGIVCSLPVGVALALGRRSGLPVVRVVCIVFIEVFRGVPLITLLFMSQVLVPLAFPHNFPLPPLLRAAIVITLFSAAYMAENIRGGLQALHPGQAEAARALGLPGWQTILLISLPQAIRNVIPAIVGQFIGLFKDTSLVYIISMVDIVNMGRNFIRGNVDYQANAAEIFIFISFVFWVFCYGMSYVSRRVEQHLGVGVR